ncbi:hypothetical protein ACFVHB_00305 [Kitasatospora sp. NPDC127111]|uniref:hypothetical protein n=1 Tax=Kitasatospora sp. NPDC127111 TaxID=3345363 RepID=UPI003628468A
MTSRVGKWWFRDRNAQSRPTGTGDSRTVRPLEVDQIDLPHQPPPHRYVIDERPAQPVPPPPPPRTPEPDEPAEAPVHSATVRSATVRFASPRAALGYLAEIVDLRVPPIEVSARDGSVLFHLDPVLLSSAPLAVRYGGEVYEGGWVPGPAGDWRPAGPADLAVHAPPGRLPEALDDVSVLVSGPLGRWVLRHSMRRGVPAGFMAVDRVDERGTVTDRSWLLVRLRSPHGPVPAALLASLLRLPDTVVCRRASPDGRLLIDVRLRLPLDDRHLLDALPEDVRQVLPAAGPAWYWSPAGIESEAALLAVPEHRPVAAAPPAGGTRAVPGSGAPMTVRVVASPAAATVRTDAVLVEDDELDLLRHFLLGRPLHESAFLVFGPGRHLVSAAPGLARGLPFGIPLRHVGPGGLYVESGCALSPPLPPSAREEVFGLRPDTVTVLGRGGAWRLDARPVPAWTLWLPEPPAFVAGVSDTAREILRRLGEEETEEPAPEAAGPGTGEARRRLLQEAAELTLQREYRAAAERLEAVGHFLQAAQMYERAADAQRPGERFR